MNLKFTASHVSLPFLICLPQAWQNEKFAPELLEHKTEVVDCILEQIREMVISVLEEGGKGRKGEWEREGGRESL